MGQRHNRKRMRHRPDRTRKRLRLATTAEQTFINRDRVSSLTDTPSPDRNLHLREFEAPRWPNSYVYHLVSEGEQVVKQETAEEHDMRIFGGVIGDAEGPELRGRMMDVVLGLFGGIDYDESGC